MARRHSPVIVAEPSETQSTCAVIPGTVKKAKKSKSEKKKKAADWNVAVQKTDRAARELVILFTPEEINSAVGSEEHLARLQKKITEGTKKKSWGTGSKVRRSRIPKHRKF